MRVAIAKMIAWPLLLLMVFGTDQAGAALSPEALTTVRHLAIQHNGRLKPFDSFARETVAQITGSPRWNQADPIETILAIVTSPERWQDEPLIAVPFIPLRGQLGLDRRTTHVSFNQLVATRTLMRRLPAIVEKERRGEQLSMLDNETMDVYRRFVALNTLLEQELYLVPSPSVHEASWIPILSPEGYAPAQQAELRRVWASFVIAVREGQRSDIEASARQLADALQNANPSSYVVPWRLRAEVFYNRFAPFRTARIIYLISCFGFLMSLIMPQRRWMVRVGFTALWAAFLSHGLGIILRVVLGGRPPVSNFYETMLWLPFVAVALAMIFERIYRVRPSTRPPGSSFDKLRTVTSPSTSSGSLEEGPRAWSRDGVGGRYFGLAAAALSAITLLLADRLPLDSSISPVVAVLRSNLWLTVHVLTIVASYGALALATCLAHIYGWLYLVRRGEHVALATFDTWLYRAIQVGVVLLAGGIMLGAVWANVSWGRYWGWDPKETWALITLLWFLAILHGRFAGWINGVGIALATIGGFFLLLMTYYGVSFYLVGLHSYAGGHAKPVPPLLIAYLMAEVVFLAAVGWMAMSRRRVT